VLKTALVGIVSALLLASCGGSASNTSPYTEHGPGFAAARAEWRLAPSVAGSAGQGIPLGNAIIDLQIGECDPLGGPCLVDHATAKYGRALQELHTLENLPDAMQTPAERRTWNRTVRALDRFFGTPGLVG